MQSAVKVKWEETQKQQLRLFTVRRWTQTAWLLTGSKWNWENCSPTDGNIMMTVGGTLTLSHRKWNSFMWHLNYNTVDQCVFRSTGHLTWRQRDTFEKRLHEKYSDFQSRYEQREDFNSVPDRAASKKTILLFSQHQSKHNHLICIYV